MVNTLIGDLGHYSVILAFVAALVSSLAYFFSTNAAELSAEHASWRKLARGAFYVHVLAVLGIVFCLFNIIYEHRYEYHYAWSHSSNHLPVHYMISCFWEGQEGSFLLWIFWHALLGLVLIRFGKKWEGPVMAVFSFVQLFLTSMILGVVIGDLKIGSSPFILMRDFMTEAPVFQMDPNFVPKDGTGLNPLLQNYWMVIHPPVLFLGFAATLVPFAFAMAGLWRKDFSSWTKPALPWALFAAVVLGIGIMMGAYWAYETLNFGGYWNWDPVENAVYIPWLVLVGAIHTLLAYRKSRTALRATFILFITSFLLVLYATFLTRSGILGNASVHSFTDLGLSGQLFTYLAAFLVLSIGLLMYRWKKIPATDKEIATYSGEFWVFIGAAVLCLGAFQVLFTTSIPVYNSFMGFIGVKTNVALPADQIQHYTNAQLWLGVAIAILSGTGQLLWWRKQNAGEKLSQVFMLPLMLTFLFTSLILLLGKLGVLDRIDTPKYIVLLITALYAIFSNLSIVFGVLRKRVSIAGGAVAHIGVALMLLGILFSAGYSNIISKNMSGMVYAREFGDEINRDNVLLWRNAPTDMGPYTVTYKGQYLEVEGLPEYVNKQQLFRIADEFKAIARGPLKDGDKVVYTAGDTVNIYPENTYYQVEYKNRETKEAFLLYPRAQVNPEMGLLASPDIKMFGTKDLYTHVSTIPDPEEEKEWSELKEYKVKMGDTIFVNDYVAVLHGIEPAKDTLLLNLGPNDVAVQADMQVLGEKRTYHAHPIYAIRDKMVGRVPEEIEDLGLRIMLMNIDPENGEFTIGVNTTQKDYIILKAMEKPFISILWIGTLVMSLGFVMAIVRHYKDGKNNPVSTLTGKGAAVKREKQLV
ncbi:MULTISPECIES: cytochrome c biogenesis protein CcsA [Rufibacter]|uniref:Cytochrome c-type biogenesis protein CcmF n=1 Tax=Rufibacter quisquiliarum TaxID=1549639 RepID=A0A839GAP2_9BACT|nr:MULTISPECIES: cytochrome c biogenesis protein CcsA [Rufibacter]MBA9076604.1 cytochrome c-type biogenesis protein CcmF [Rufibacter quisquiliarum]